MDDSLVISIKEGSVHRDVVSGRKRNKILSVSSEGLQEIEHISPLSRIETNYIISESIDDLIEISQALDGFDNNGALDELMRAVVKIVLDG